MFRYFCAAFFLLTGCAVPQPEGRITDEAVFRADVVGKPLTNAKGGFVVAADGTLSGNIDEAPFVGTWDWENGRFCRGGQLGETRIPRTCLRVFRTGDQFTVERDGGILITYRISG